MDNLSTSADTLTSLNQRNIEALTRSSRIWAEGLQEISKTMAAMAQAQLDNTMSVCTALGKVKSIAEATDLHTRHAHACCTTAIADTTALGKATMKLAEDTIAPLTSHLSQAH
jgi:hypothetical protein